MTSVAKELRRDHAHRLLCMVNELCRRQDERLRADIRKGKKLMHQTLADASRKASQ